MWLCLRCGRRFLLSAPCSGGPCKRSRHDTVLSLPTPLYLQWNPGVEKGLQRRSPCWCLGSVGEVWGKSAERITFFVCVSRNSCVSLHLLLLCRRNIEFDSYVFFLYVTPLIYAIAFYCLQNEVFKLEAFRWFMIFQKNPNKNWNKFSQILWTYWSLFFLGTIRYWRWCCMGKSSKKNMLQAGLSPLLKPECPSMITEVNCDALPGISFGLMLGVHCHHLMWKFIHLLLETWVWG